MMNEGIAEGAYTEVIFVRTPPCLWPSCKHEEKRSVFCLPKKEATDWLNNEGPKRHIQNAFPWMTADRREQLISGTHSDCWDDMWKED